MTSQGKLSWLVTNDKMEVNGEYVKREKENGGAHGYQEVALMSMSICD